MRDDDLEYRFKPSSSFHRFGNTIRFNRYSMRSPDFADQKADGEYRLLVLGDSIPSGGAQTDDAELATTLLVDRLAERGDPVTVLNASAGSWGPINLKRYTDRYGFFDADAVVIILNEGDAVDPIGESPVGKHPSYPEASPWLATTELLTRYVGPRLFGIGGESELPRVDSDNGETMQALADLLESTKATGANVAVIYWPTRAEFEGEYLPAHATLAATVAAVGVPFIDAKPLIPDTTIYRDAIHPNPAGQAVLADVIEATLEHATTRPSRSLRRVGFSPPSERQLRARLVGWKPTLRPTPVHPSAFILLPFCINNDRNRNQTSQTLPRLSPASNTSSSPARLWMNSSNSPSGAAKSSSSPSRKCPG